MSSADQGPGIARSLDESGAVIVLGDAVLLRPDQEFGETLLTVTFDGNGRSELWSCDIHFKLNIFLKQNPDQKLHKKNTFYTRHSI